MARTVRFSQVLWFLTTAWLAACGRIGFGDGGRPDGGGVGAAPPADAMVSVADAPPTGPVMKVTTTGQMLSPCGGVVQTQTITFTNVGDSELVIDGGTFTNNFGAVSGSMPLRLQPGASASLDVAPPDATVGTDHNGDKITGTLTVITNEAVQTPPPIDLVTTVIGATINIATLNGKPVNSGDTNLVFAPSSTGGCPSPGTVGITLTAASTINVDALSVPGYGLSAFTGGALSSASGRSIVIQTSASTDCTQPTRDLVITSTTDPVCQPATVHISQQAPCSC